MDGDRSVFDEFIDDPLINDRVLAAVELIEQAGDTAEFSTLLHIMVVDYNLEDHWFDLRDADVCRGYTAAEPWEQMIFDALRSMTEQERVTVIGMLSGRVNPARPEWARAFLDAYNVEFELKERTRPVRLWVPR